MLSLSLANNPVSLNDSKVLQSLIEDQNIVGVLGALECKCDEFFQSISNISDDPAFPNLKANHREYFNGDSLFKEVVPIQDEEIRFKIKQTYRLQFMKDVLARILDESTIVIFTSMIYFNQLSIVIALQTSSDYMTQLFAIYGASPGNVDQKRDGVHLVHQISLATKGFQNQQKKMTFTKLISSGLYSLLEFALNDTVESIRILGTELLLTIIDIDAALIRNYTQNSQANSTFALMQTLVTLFFKEDDIGLKYQVIEALKYMLDTMTTALLSSLEDTVLSRRTSQELENDVFVASFYTNCGRKLFSSFGDLGEGRASVKPSISLSQRAFYELLCDLLNFCVRMHGAKCREFSIEQGLWKGVAVLIACPFQTIQLAALRCWKQALNLEDETYIRHFAANGLAESVVDVLARIGNKNNLVTSTCLEILDFMRIEMSNTSSADKIVAIVGHLVKSRRFELEEKLKFTDISKQLIEEYENHLEEERSLLPSSKFKTISSSLEYSLSDHSPIMPLETPEIQTLKHFDLDPSAEDDSRKEIEPLVPYDDSEEEEVLFEDANEETDSRSARVLKRLRESDHVEGYNSNSQERVSTPPRNRARTVSPEERASNNTSGSSQPSDASTADPNSIATDISVAHDSNESLTIPPLSHLRQQQSKKVS